MLNYSSTSDSTSSRETQLTPFHGAGFQLNYTMYTVQKKLQMHMYIAEQGHCFHCTNNDSKIK